MMFSWVMFCWILFYVVFAKFSNLYGNVFVLWIIMKPVELHVHNFILFLFEYTRKYPICTFVV